MIEQEIEKPNGKTTPLEAARDYQGRYSQQTIERVLQLYVEGKSFQDLGPELNIPVSNFYEWARRERQKGTELGQRLCVKAGISRRAKPKAPLQSVEFPGGSVYVEGENGRAIIQEEPKQDEEVLSSSKSEEALSDEILGEVALRLGRREIEIISLKARLRKR